MRAHIPFLMALVAAGCAEVSEEPEADPAAAIAPIELPIEVMPTNPAHFGTDQFSVARAFALTGSELQSLADGGVLYLQGHGLGYRDGHEVGGALIKDGKASVRFDGGPWIALVNDSPDVVIATPESYYEGIGGGFRTVRLTIPLARLCAGVTAACSTPGGHVIELRWNGTDGTGSGYRIVDLNLVTRGGVRVLTRPTDIYDVDPSTWTPPLTSASDRAEGDRLFHERGLLVDNVVHGARIIASCSDCHARDGRDLEYYAFSNGSIRNRAVFHGLTITQGDQIASYIRQLPGVVRRGRPWNPPYQPGVGRDAAGVLEWAAGAGVSAVLDEENATMLGQVLPYGTTIHGITRAIQGDGLPQATINLREVPIAIQLPDWNSWLPEVHPIDQWGACGWEGAGDGTFAQRTNRNAGDPDGLVTADFDGDGALDLAYANYATGTMSVQRGLGDGTFSYTVNTAAGAGAIAVAVADFDEDGDLDAVVANYAARSASVLLGDGDGTFTPAGTANTGGNPHAVVTGDFDGDGHADFAVANSLDDTVSVYRGTGAGTFLARRTSTVGDAPMGLAAGDFDGDGMLDLAVANELSHSVGVLRGRGTGLFDPMVAYGTGTLPPVAVRAGDLDHDGLVDLAAGGMSTTAVLLGAGGGRFDGATFTGGGGYGLALADLDGDGHVDIVGAAYGRAVIDVTLGHGDGTFASPQSYATGAGPTRVALGDFDRDGAIDAATSNRDADNLSVLLANSCLPAGVGVLPQTAYLQERAALAALDLHDPADVATLPAVLGPVEDAVLAYLEVGWRSGTANQDDWRTIRGDVMDLAVLRGYSMELVKRDVAQWLAVKNWEVMHEYKLEALGREVYGVTDGEVYEWPSGGHQAVFPVAPHKTSVEQNRFRDPDTYDPADLTHPAQNACDDFPDDLDCAEPMHAEQTTIKADYDSNAWYHLQLLLHAGARSRDVPFVTATRPVDWPYSLEHVDDLGRDIKNSASNPGRNDPPWESLRYLATMIKAYQMRDNGDGPSLIGWSMRDVSPRLLVGSWRGEAENVELLTHLDDHGIDLRAHVTNAFLDAFLEITDENVHPEFVDWPRLVLGATNQRESWWKIDDVDYPVSDVTDGPDLEFGHPYFHHADDMYRTASRLASAGATADRINRFIDWAESLWGTNPGANWESLRPMP